MCFLFACTWGVRSRRTAATAQWGEFTVVFVSLLRDPMHSLHNLRLELSVSLWRLGDSFYATPHGRVPLNGGTMPLVVVGDSQSRTDIT